jgi:hypothetical protein
MNLIPARISFKEGNVCYEMQKESLLRAILWCREMDIEIVDTHYDTKNGIWVLVCEGKDEGEQD